VCWDWLWRWRCPDIFRTSHQEPVLELLFYVFLFARMKLNKWCENGGVCVSGRHGNSPKTAILDMTFAYMTDIALETAHFVPHSILNMTSY
jgi:hypothetical protein